MKLQKSLTVRVPARGEWSGLVLISVSSSLIAACIHSLFVFHRGDRLYNAELGFFFDDGPQTERAV